MINEILLAIIQAATEFLPVSSSGHLAFFSNLSEPNLFFFTALHIASLIAVIIFTRKEISTLFKFKGNSKKLWLCIIIATIPAVLIGIFLKPAIKASFSSFLFLGFAFLFTGTVLFFTKYTRENSKLNYEKSIFIGLFQALALFPGISRSGMTISSGLFSGLNREKAAKFSFLLFIPLSIGAFVSELGNFYINASLIISFIICLLLSLVFLNFLFIILKKNNFWIFSFYCWVLGIISLILYFL